MIPVFEPQSAEDLLQHYRHVLARRDAGWKRPLRKDDDSNVTNLLAYKRAKDRSEAKKEDQEEKEAEEAWTRQVQIANTSYKTRRECKRIILDVAFRYNLTIGDIIGKSRVQLICRARHEAIQAVRKQYPEKSLDWLGRIFNRDHSTIHHALSKVLP